MAYTDSQVVMTLAAITYAPHSPNHGSAHTSPFKEKAPPCLTHSALLLVQA
jgi:hypothetical protein